MVAYYALPKPLFIDVRYVSISIEAKTLYACLRDRLNLSIKNNEEKKGSWEDESGVYILMARKSIAEFLKRSLPTVRKIIGELKKVGLLRERRMGLTKCNRLYVQPLEGENSAPLAPEKDLPANGNILPSSGKGVFIPEGKPFASNNGTPKTFENRSFARGKKVENYEVYGDTVSSGGKKWPKGSVPAQQYTQREYAPGQLQRDLEERMYEEFFGMKE